jgi:transcriptional regulator with XRE-family HTH domain/quercetin dioxygenase-like cupin family protein
VYDCVGEVSKAVSRQADPPIGQRIREERLRRGFNLRALARAVNVSASHISQIETGKCRPSVSTLYAITTVLGVSIDDVFDGARTELDTAALAVAQESPAAAAVAASPPRAIAGPSPGAAAALVALASEHARRVGPVIGPGERETLELDSGVTWERLGHVPGLHVDFLLITYAPGGSSSSTDQLMRHPGTEYGYLISGQLIVTLGFSEHQIVPGDAICFSSLTPHRYRNEGSEQAVGVWFVANPDAP